ncbi:MAG: cyclic pyranopterin monophosphate synthase MoaC [Methylotenera sp.]|nr:cyclic pyranopterin monophosphate synthase MoaC [Oligoflexia bacterium]
MLTHIDEKNQQPTMVDVSGKAVTQRVARAQSRVQLPPELRPYFQGKELILKKGPVFHTAIIAGTMAAKKTHEIIPFCHQIPIESCKFTIEMDDSLRVTVQCEVKTTSRTGVEMEALTGAMTAALTIYDMCKAVSHDIVIEDTRLLSKIGGKRTVLDRPLYGLVLTGGKSERMKRDKALISYHGKPHAQYIREILKNHCQEVYLSAQQDQWAGTALEKLPTVVDSRVTSGPASGDVRGPIVGILSAFAKHPDAHWLVVACDLIHFNSRTVENLLASHDPAGVATAYRNSEKDFAEPLCALYTPAARSLFTAALESGIQCPVKVLKNAQIHEAPEARQIRVIDQTEGVNLANVNTFEEFAELA